MRFKTRHAITCMVIIFALSFALASMAAAAGSITLNPTSTQVNNQVIVTGSGFGAAKAVGIGLGQEVTVTGEARTPTGTGMGPYSATLLHYPIKPGSLSISWDTSGTVSEITDSGDGTLASTSTYFAGGTINYVTGVFARSSTTDISSYTMTATCSYTYYALGVTPAAGVTSTGSGTFTTNITIPANAINGTNTVTAIDTAGNKGTATLTVTNGVPEALTFSMIALLTSIAVIASYFWKRPKTNHKKI